MPITIHIEVLNLYTGSDPDALRPVRDILERIELKMDSFSTDEARLEADVTTETNLITAVAAVISDNKTQIAALTAEVAALKASGVDTTQFEAALTAIEANNTQLSAIAPPAPPVVPTPTV